MRDSHKFLFLDGKKVILTETQIRRYNAAYMEFIARQETLLQKEMKKINNGEMLRKSSEQLKSEMTEEKHNGIWHNAVRKLLLKIMHGTKTFWRVNVAQYLSKEPSDIFQFYSTMTAIYLGPKERRSAVAKKIIPRVNKITDLSAA
jgi:hypothetical protein